MLVTWKGRQYKFHPKRKQSQNPSKGHLRARHLLQKLWPFEFVFEEVKLSGTRLFVDFILLNYRMAVEVQGRQHFEHVGHFHATVTDFWKARTRDNVKRAWLEENDFTLVELIDSEDDKTWEKQLKDALMSG